MVALFFLCGTSAFWGEKSYGWHYDLMFLIMNLVILFTDGGRWVLMK
jgi:putative oxidoreductase